MKSVLFILLLIIPTCSFAADQNCPSPGTLKEKTEKAWKLDEDKKYSESKPLLDEACKCEFLDACASLGFRLTEEAANGWLQGDKKKEGIRLLTYACERNNGYGCLLYGYYFHNTHATDARTKETEFYKKSCELKYAVGCFEYGKTFVSFSKSEDSCKKETGLDCSASRKRYSQQACDLGCAEGCFDVSEYSTDESDLDLANLKKACDGIENPEGKQKACTALQKLQQHLHKLQAIEEDVKQHGPVLTYQDLDRMVHVGMKIGKPYRVLARYTMYDSASFLHPIEERNANGFLNTESLRVSTDVLSQDQRGTLYDLKNKVGCFEVSLMGNGTLEMTNVKARGCN